MRYVISSSSRSPLPVADISPAQQRRYRTWIQEAIFRKRYKIYVKKAPGWLGEYHRNVLLESTNVRYRELWRSLCREHQPLPPRLVRYVPVWCRKYVQGPLFLPSNENNHDSDVVQEKSDSNDNSATTNDDSTTITDAGALWCCVNKCVETYKRREEDACGFCTYVEDDEEHRSTSRYGPSSTFSCLCDCTMFRYHMCWRGEYVRKMRVRYDSTMVRYASFSERALAYSADLVITHQSVTLDSPDTIIMVTNLVSCALAAMGFAPISTSSRINNFAVRCHRCFATIRLADKNDASLVRFMNDLNFPPDSIVCANTFSHDPSTHRLNRAFRAINALHARANPFCPYVANLPSETLTELAKRRNDEFRDLIVYATRFNLPGYGRQRMLMWNEIPVSPAEDTLFRICEVAGDRGDESLRHVSTEHAWCTRYDDSSVAAAATIQRLDPREDERTRVLVRARPINAYRPAIEFVGARHLYSKRDRSYDESIERILIRSNRLNRWLKARLNIDEESDVEPPPPLSIGTLVTRDDLRRCNFDISDGDDSCDDDEL